MEVQSASSQQPGELKAIDCSALEAAPSGRILKTLLFGVFLAVLAANQILPKMVQPSVSESGVPVPVTFMSFLPLLIPLGLILLVFVTFASVLFVIFGLVILKKRHNEAVQKFAQSNGWKLADEAAMSGGLPSALRSMGSQLFMNGYVGKYADRDVLIYEFEYTVGSGNDSRTYPFTIACLSTKNNYPELFIDSHANGEDTAYYRVDQRIKLEGDFDKYFSLFAAKGEQVDAMSIVTPDIMELLINQGKTMDVEIKGTQISVIATGSSLNRTQLPGMLSLVGGLAAKFDRLDVVYNAASNTVGTQTSSATSALKRSRTPIIIVVASVLMAVCWQFGLFRSLGAFGIMVPTVVVFGLTKGANYWRNRR